MCCASIVDFFFFSSRRRHTRCSRDWSSDVCSSDLDGGSRKPFPHFGFVAIARDGEAEQRTDVDAGVTLDALDRREYSFDVAVEAALHFARGLLRVEAKLYFDI